MMIYVHRETWA